MAVTALSYRIAVLQRDNCCEPAVVARSPYGRLEKVILIVPEEKAPGQSAGGSLSQITTITSAPRVMGIGSSLPPQIEATQIPMPSPSASSYTPANTGAGRVSSTSIDTY